MILSLRGRLTFAEAGPLWTDVHQRVVDVKRGEHVDFDMSEVEAVDGGTMALLVHLRGELAARGVVADFAGARDDVQELIHLYRGDIRPVTRKKRRHEGILNQLGRATFEFFVEVKGVLAFFGDVVLAALGLLKEP